LESGGGVQPPSSLARRLGGGRLGLTPSEEDEVLAVRALDLHRSLAGVTLVLGDVHRPGVLAVWHRLDARDVHLELPALELSEGSGGGVGVGVLGLRGVLATREHEQEADANHGAGDKPAEAVREVEADRGDQERHGDDDQNPVGAAHCRVPPVDSKCHDNLSKHVYYSISTLIRPY